jgi:hypothetical protein
MFWFSTINTKELKNISCVMITASSAIYITAQDRPCCCFAITPFNKENAVHIHNGVLFSHRRMKSAICGNLDEPEAIMLCETSQAQKSK